MRSEERRSMSENCLAQRGLNRFWHRTEQAILATLSESGGELLRDGRRRCQLGVLLDPFEHRIEAARDVSANREEPT